MTAPQTNARPNAQVWCFSNAGDISSVVLRHLRLKAHRKVVDDNPQLGGLTVDDLAAGF